MISEKFAAVKNILKYINPKTVGWFLASLTIVFALLGYLHFVKILNNRDYQIAALVGSAKTLEEVIHFAENRRSEIVGLTDTAQKKEAYLLWGYRAILEYLDDYHLRTFGVHGECRQRHMTNQELRDFLSAIYDYAHTPQFSQSSCLFLPLAYAAVETHFHPDVVGRDGERSVFQFMEETARITYTRIGQIYNPNFWRDPNEYVKLWFNYQCFISPLYRSDDEERQIRWTAIAYNAGEGRIGLKYHFDRGSTIDAYFKEYPLKYGIQSYNRDIYINYLKFKEDFYR